MVSKKLLLLLQNIKIQLMWFFMNLKLITTFHKDHKVNIVFKCFNLSTTMTTSKACDWCIVALY